MSVPSETEWGADAAHPGSTDIGLTSALLAEPCARPTERWRATFARAARSLQFGEEKDGFLGCELTSPEADLRIGFERLPEGERFLIRAAEASPPGDALVEEAFVWANPRWSVMRTLLLPGMDGSGQLFKGIQEHLPPSLEAEVVPYPGCPEATRTQDRLVGGRVAHRMRRINSALQVASLDATHLLSSENQPRQRLPSSSSSSEPLGTSRACMDMLSDCRRDCAPE